MTLPPGPPAANASHALNCTCNMRQPQRKRQLCAELQTQATQQAVTAPKPQRSMRNSHHTSTHVPKRQQQLLQYKFSTRIPPTPAPTLCYSMPCIPITALVTTPVACRQKQSSSTEMNSTRAWQRQSIAGREPPQLQANYSDNRLINRCTLTHREHTYTTHSNYSLQLGPSSITHSRLGICPCTCRGISGRCC